MFIDPADDDATTSVGIVVAPVPPASSFDAFAKYNVQVLVHFVSSGAPGLPDSSVCGNSASLFPYRIAWCLGWKKSIRVVCTSEPFVSVITIGLSGPIGV